MSEPKLYIESEEEAVTLFKEWQHRLFLDDWNIQLVFVEHLGENAGEANVQWTNSCGTISILTEEAIKREGSMIEKVIHEKLIIHELLHFKYMGFNDKSTIEATYYNELQHRKLEQMSKALYMAKYNVGYEWFKA